MHDPSVLIVSVSFDFSVKLWGIDGGIAGKLQQGAIINSAFGREEAKKGWKIRVDEEARRRKHREETIDIPVNSDDRRTRFNVFFKDSRQQKGE